MSSPNPPSGCSTASASTGRTVSGRARATASTATIPTARLIGQILIPEMVANVTFGGVKRNRLFICGTTSLYGLYLKVNG